MALWARYEIWYGLAAFAWNMLWPGGHHMVYGMAWQTSHGIWYGLARSFYVKRHSITCFKALPWTITPVHTLSGRRQL